MNKRDKRVFIKILTYCKDVNDAHKIFGNSEELFFDAEAGRVYRNAVSMAILQIGELANHLTEEMFQTHKDIPWKQIIGMRNIAAHHYEEWRYKTAWDVSQQDVPELSAKIKAILDADEDAQ